MQSKAYAIQTSSCRLFIASSSYCIFLGVQYTRPWMLCGEKTRHFPLMLQFAFSLNIKINDSSDSSIATATHSDLLMSSIGALRRMCYTSKQKTGSKFSVFFNTIIICFPRTPLFMFKSRSYCSTQKINKNHEPKVEKLQSATYR